MAGLRIEKATKTFGDFDAVKDVTLDVGNGEFLAVLGPSGCGKTTMLRLIAGFEQPSRGRILIGDREVASQDVHIPPEKRRVGIVFQNYALWPHMTVAENVGYALRVARVSKAEREKLVREALELVDLTGFDERRPANLSGGQRQRVALARCLVAAPSLVLFDEPLANLDVHLRASMEDEFAAFHKRTGTTIIYITHDQAEAMALADRIAVMDQGRLVQLATPRELYSEPANEMVASFIANGMVLPARIVEAERDGHCVVEVFGAAARVRCRPGEAPRDDASICVRASDLAIAGEAEPAFTAMVKRAVYRGGGARIEMECRGRELAIDQPDPVNLEPNMSARIAIRSGWLIPASTPSR